MKRRTLKKRKTRKAEDLWKAMRFARSSHRIYTRIAEMNRISRLILDEEDAWRWLIG